MGPASPLGRDTGRLAADGFMPETPFERTLVSRLQEGEPEALAGLFELYVDRVYAYSRQILGNREDAEEVTSEAFLRAFTHAVSFRGEGSFKGWLFRIVRNLCLDKKRQPRLMLMDADFETDQSSDQGRAQQKMETAIMVRHALEELSEEYRTILLLCDVEEWDAMEAAQMLQRTLPSIKSQLYRARRALRNRLQEMSMGETSTNAM